MIGTAAGPFFNAAVCTSIITALRRSWLPPATLCTFQGHKKLHDDGDLYLRQLCLGYGCSTWDKKARHKLEQLPVCPCGLEQPSRPSRPHLLWHCPHFSSMRRSLGPVADRLGERLLAGAVPELLRSRRFWTLARLTRSSLLHSRGTTWALLRHRRRRRGPVFLHGGVGGLFAAAAAGRTRGLLYPCHGLQGRAGHLEGRWTPPLLCAEPQSFRALAVQLQAKGTHLELVWVSSHGKPVPSSWTPCRRCSLDRLRAINARADEAAGRLARRRAAGSLRQRWRCLSERREAERWERKVLSGAAGIAGPGRDVCGR